MKIEDYKIKKKKENVKSLFSDRRMANEPGRLPRLDIQTRQSVRLDRQRPGRNSILIIGQRSLKCVELLRAATEPVAPDRRGPDRVQFGFKQSPGVRRFRYSR